MHARDWRPTGGPKNWRPKNRRQRDWRPGDWQLTTAEILYHMPDHPAVLQTFIWQDFDLAPEFPELRRFLAFWRREIEGRLHSVRVATAGPWHGKWRHADHLLTLH